MIPPEMDDAKAYHAIPSDPDVLEEEIPSRSRWGPNPRYLIATVAALILEWATMFWVVSLGDSTRDYFVFTFMFGAAIAIVMVVNRSNPGVVPKNVDLELYQREALPATEVELNQTRFIQRWCVACRLYKPPRVKHCYECGRCISRFDHHCPWMSNCIGSNNYKMFMLFWQHYFGMQIFSVYFIGLSMSQLSATSKVSLGDGAIRSFASENPFLIFLLVLACIRLPVVAYITMANAYFICRNMTYYEYLTQPYEGKNPFDQGLCQNIYTFMALPWIDLSRE
ncbi:zinc finger DHHC domain containing protein [Babesia ovata]|uniref:Palmitoyltransferase n=1 Tax=Babesia ovata TaxID=189622 RepID=A0A2H6KA05_9APIC|nr:zinc finger DHHC domain containing protein [Babesia ovata]GBE59818.1 zinc finger DHHC domain containing protein [Babesia ovata]